MREKLGLVLLFILVAGWAGKCFDSCDKTPSSKANDNAKLFPVQKCSCWRKALPFSGFINRDNPDAGYEIYCKATLRNNSKETIKNASIRIYLLTKNDYELDSIKVRAAEDIYSPGTQINFVSDSAIDNIANFYKARCELLNYE